MTNDFTEKDIKNDLRAFGVHVKELAENRQGMVIAKLRAEINRLRPQAYRLLHGTDEPTDSNGQIRKR